MNEKTTSTRVRVYKYGLRPPTIGAQEVREQLWLAHRYYNQLVAVERDRHADIKAIKDRYVGDGAPTSEAIDALDAQYKQAKAEEKRAREREDKAEIKLLTDKAKELLTQLKTAQAAYQAASKLLREDDEVLAAFEAANATSHMQHIDERAESSPHWGTYLLVERAVDAAKEAAGKMGSAPDFARWSDEGTIGVQIQKGISPTDLLDDTRVRILPVEDRLVRGGKHNDPLRAPTRPGRYANLWLRVGSTDKRRPVWAVFPMHMHRHIHPLARIKWVSVTLRREGTRDVWTTSITVEEPAIDKRTGVRAIAIDIGWRSLDDLRAAYWYDSDGRHGEIRVPNEIITGLEKADSLRSIRDEHRNALRAALVPWLVAQRKQLPTWFVERTQMIAQWLSQRRFAKLFFAWRKRRFDHDDVGFAMLEAWWKHEHHLYDWEAAQRRKSLERRNNGYGVWAAEIARSYDHVIIEDFNLKKFAIRTPSSDKAKEKREHHERVNRTLAAPASLRSAVNGACENYSSTLYKEPAPFTTRDCHACGHREKWDQANELRHTCSACDTAWDQDDNACRNLLINWRERGGPALAGVERSRPRKSRFARRKEKCSQTTAQSSGTTADI